MNLRHLRDLKEHQGTIVYNFLLSEIRLNSSDFFVVLEYLQLLHIFTTKHLSSHIDALI